MAASNTTAAEARTVDPSVWGDFFIDYVPKPMQMLEGSMRERVNQLRKEVCGLFEACSDSNAVHQMSLVDTLQHLSIDHLFQEQIDATLRSIHGCGGFSSLHEVALRFRLLRTHGLWVSPDELISKFRGDDGSFRTEITNDHRGLLSLYNAAHLLTHGEVELEEAIPFARHHLGLGLLTSSLRAPLAGQVTRALKLPLPRTLKRLEALDYMSEYTQEQTYNPSILELAKLDFNLLQRLHLKELKAISQWWKDIYQEVELNYMRDRVVECFFWCYTVYYEQDLSRARTMLTKIFALITVVDDTFDDHATLDESGKLAEALRRWDDSAVSMLPEYLRKFYLRLLRNFEDFEDELQPNERYRVAYTREAFQMSSESYLQESEWFHHNCKPSFKEHVKVSTVSVGPQLGATGMLMGMGDEATRDAFEWALRGDTAVMIFGRIARFLNDIASFNSGKSKNDVATSVECYMNEYNVTSEVAMTEIGYLIEDGWKTANRARFEHPELLPAVQRLINLTVCMPFMYRGKKDAHTSGKDMETIERLFINPIPL
ncbi:tau-cadinol synthase-like [Miscanthus floridulus]|uniref:tau-cadinol synthase-like n=1 Tax=Miscanthus floridulus TaxID=154761 RepID=UPI003459F258